LRHQLAVLNDSYLLGANLVYAELLDASLSDALFISANLSGASLTDASLANANLTFTWILRQPPAHGKIAVPTRGQHRGGTPIHCAPARRHRPRPPPGHRTSGPVPIC
jgi:hypothetical protein